MSSQSNTVSWTKKHHTDTSGKIDVVAIIPAYNESKNIIKIVNEVQKYVSTVIVVDDGSNDDTYERAKSTCAIVIRNMRNRGKGAALKRGFAESFKLSPSVVLTIDADGQHDPTDIPKLLEPIQKEQADIVIGSRFHTGAISEIPFRRGMGLSVINILNKILIRSHVKDTQSGFRAYNNEVFSLIADFDTFGYGAETEQLAYAENHGANIIEVPVTIKYRGLENTSKKNAFSHGLHLLSTIIKIAVEKRPLQIFGLAGMGLILLSIIPLANMLIVFNETRYFSIPLSLIVLGLVFNGALLIVVAFILYALKRIRHKISIRY
jgi:glycosyltransferase involved in cell wall biosynthesis